MQSLSRNMLLWIAAAAAAASLTTALVVPDDVGKLPALGWNSWNAYGCDVSEAKILAAAQYVVDLGLKDAGYEYVNIDDCWSVEAGRDNVTQRLIPDPTKFPDGINGTAAQIHALGLKLGIYSSAGTKTCAGYPASLGYETIDAETWAEWGVDYLKYDNCYVPANWTDSCEGCVPDGTTTGPNGTCTGLSGNYCPAGYDYATSLTAERYMRMRDALNATGRPFLYSLCEWGDEGVQEWGAETANSWRATGDITANWARILQILNENSFYLNNVNFYGHSDPDMLEVGNGDLTPAETRSHFAFWAAMKGPLLIGTDLATINATDLAVLTNPTLLNFSQDATIGKPAMPYKWGTNPDWTFNASFPAEYWSGTFHDKTVWEERTLVLVLNVYNETQRRTVSWAEVPQLAATRERIFGVVDGWTGANLGCHWDSITVDVEMHDTAMLVVGGPC